MRVGGIVVIVFMCVIVRLSAVRVRKRLDAAPCGANGASADFLDAQSPRLDRQLSEVILDFAPGDSQIEHGAQQHVAAESAETVEVQMGGHLASL